MPSLPNPAAPSSARLPDRLVLWVAALAALVAACSARDLWAPDEPRYGQVAREMLEHGHWLTPHANGQPYAEKPPLFFWLVALGGAASGGVSAVGARCVGALSAALAVLAVARLARRWFDVPGLAATAAALFVGNLLVVWNASRAGLDLPLTCAVLWAVERGGTWLRTGSVTAAAVGGLCWSAALLFKGPLGLLIPPVVLAAESLALRQRPAWWNPGWWAGPVVMALPGLLWMWLAFSGGDDAYRERLLGQIQGRITGAEGHHLGPVWDYLLTWPVMALPVAAHLAAGAFVALRPWREQGEARAGLAAAFVAGPLQFVLLSLTATKRDVYLIPGTPFVALAAAYALHRGLLPRWEQFARWVLVLACAGLALGTLALPLLTRQLLKPESSLLHEPLTLGSWAALAPVALLLGWAAFEAWRQPGDVVAGLRRAVVGVLAAFVVLALGYLPQVDRNESFRPVAAEALRAAGQGPVYYAGFYQPANLLWGLHRESVERVDDLPGLARVLGPGSPRASLVATAGWWEAQRKAAAADPVLGPALDGVRETWRDQTGRRVLVVLTNSPP